MRGLGSLLLLLSATRVDAFGVGSGMRRRGSSRVASIGSGPRMAEGDDENAFAAFAKQVRQQNLKKGEGAPTKDASLPIRLGGATRDGSLGDVRAAWNNLGSIRSPRDLGGEEIGLLTVFAIFGASTAFFYYTYVDPPKPSGEVQISAGQQELRARITACDSSACVERAQAEMEPTLVLERQLDDCNAKAFSSTERNLCKKKFGGAKTPFGF
jgi:hypothetical protein